MKLILSEKNLVVILFVAVIVTFSLAQEDSRKMTSLYADESTLSAGKTLGELTAQSVNMPGARFSNH